MTISKKNISLLGVIIVGFFIIRLYIASISSFGFYHGWYEGYISSMARNYFSHSLWYKTAIIGDSGFHTMTPFYSYAVFSSFKLFGISDINARLVSLISEIIALVAIYALSKELYNQRIAYLSTIIFLFTPWNILWFGRVNAEPLVTALMTGAIALYINAYKNNKNFLPFGIFFGFAVFTKQTALSVIIFIALWTYFNVVDKKKIKSALIAMLIGLVPLFIWTFYHIINGNLDFVKGLWFTEFLHRSAPFSDLNNVIMTAILGFSLPVLAFSVYEIIKMENKKKNILFIWFIIYGVFVLVRTPPSHEYYLLPLTPPAAILTARGIERFSQYCITRVRYFVDFNKNKFNTAILLIIIMSTIPFSYVILIYSGELGYTSTKDTADFLVSYMDQNPHDSFLVVAPNKYLPQIVWYANLTYPGYSNRQVYSISNDLSSVSESDIENTINDSNSNSIFLVIDDRGGLIERISTKYKQVYSSEYNTRLPNMAGLYTKEPQNSESFEQKLVVFQLK